MPAEFVEKWGPIVRQRFGGDCELDYSHKYQAVCVHDMRNPKAIREVVTFRNGELKKHHFTEREVFARVERVLSLVPGNSNGPL
jgi:hypothetical protein